MLARDLREAGDYDGSAELLRETYTTTWAELLGEDDLGTLSTAQSLAVSLRKAGKLEEASPTDHDTSERYSRGASPGTQTRSPPAEPRRDQAALGDKAAAYAIASEVHQDYERSLGSSHPFTLAVASNMAGYLRGTGASAGGAAASRVHVAIAARQPR